MTFEVSVISGVAKRTFVSDTETAIFRSSSSRSFRNSPTVLRGTITPGMSARGKLSIDTGREGVTVPRDAILRFPDGRVTVWVVDAGDDLPVVREQLVQTGSEFNGSVEVTNGLTAGDVVVVRGNEMLQEGQAVSILNGGR